MFKGIIQEIGTIVSLQKNEAGCLKIQIQSSGLHQNCSIGDSIAIDGACQTIIAKNQQSFHIQAVPETLKLTNFPSYQIGSKVNLELPITLQSLIDGHLLTGHIDGTGTVKNLKNNFLSISFPAKISQYLALKGSISVNGVSLTIAKLLKHQINIALIPHTIASTNLSAFKKGSKVNLEVDLIARYLERLLEAKEQQTKYGWLRDRNFI